MLDVKEAGKETSAAIPQLFADVSDIRLEAVELTEDERFWLVTFSFMRPESSKPVKSPFGEGLEALLQRGNGREYKVVRIDANNGRLLGVANCKS